MATLEQVERLRGKTNVSFEDAKAALEASNGDLLDAIIYLEKHGKVAPPSGGGYYSNQNTTNEYQSLGAAKEPQPRPGESFSDMMARFGRFLCKLFDKGNTNYLEAKRYGKTIFSLPVTVVVVLMIFLFWVVVPLFAVSLFFSFRYSFRGNDLGKESVNKVMDGASNAADEIKRSFNGETK